MTLCAKFGSESRSYDSDLVEYLVPLPSVCGVPVRPAPVRAGRYRAVPCRPLQPRQEQDPIGACAPFSLCVGARHLRSFFSLVQVQLRITGFVGTGRSQATQVASPPAAPRAPAPSRAPPQAERLLFRLCAVRCSLSFPLGCVETCCRFLPLSFCSSRP